MYTPVLVEFLGTALLIGAIAFAGSPTLVVAAFALALGFGGKISGGHFNPAVTIAVLIKEGRENIMVNLICTALIVTS